VYSLFDADHVLLLSYGALSRYGKKRLVNRNTAPSDIKYWSLNFGQCMLVKENICSHVSFKFCSPSVDFFVKNVACVWPSVDFFFKIVAYVSAPCVCTSFTIMEMCKRCGPFF
jgi:hypothetical protein